MASYVGVGGELVERPVEPEAAETAAGGNTPAARRQRPTMEPEAPKQRPRHLVTALSVLAGFALAMGGIFLISRAAPAIERVSRPSVPSVTPVLPTLAPPTPTLAAKLGAAVVAWAAPDGDVLGALSPSSTYTVTARFANEWLQVDAGSGPVWVRAADLGGTVAPSLPDLAPPTPEPTATPRPAPPQPTADLRPIVCVTSPAGQECSRDLRPGDQAIIAEIERKSRAYSAAWLATATAQAGR